MRSVLGVFLISALVVVPIAQAHGPDELPLFTINEKAPKSNSLQENGVNASYLKISREAAAESYAVNEQLSFNVNTHKLSELYPELSLEQTSYHWDFGDGTNGTGTSNTHSYTQPGSYQVTVKVKSAGQTETLADVQVAVIPTGEYQLAKPAIVVNGKRAAGETLEVNLKQPVKFEAEVEKGTADITEYLWDFGDGKQYTGQAVVYSYADAPGFTTPILRVVDTNEVQVDAYAMIAGVQHSGGVTFSTTLTGWIILGLELGVLMLGIVIFIVVMVQEKRKKR